MVALDVSCRLPRRRGRASFQHKSNGRPADGEGRYPMKLTSFLIFTTLVASTSVSTGPHVGVPPRRPGSAILLRLHHDLAARTTTVTVQTGGHASITAPRLPTLRLTPTVRPNGLLDIAVSVAAGAGVPSSNVDPTTVVTLSLGAMLHVEEAGYALDVEWVDAWGPVAPRHCLTANLSAASCGHSQVDEYSPQVSCGNAHIVRRVMSLASTPRFSGRDGVLGFARRRAVALGRSLPS